MLLSLTAAHAVTADLPTFNLAEADKKIGSLTRLLCDPDIDAAAKKAISRQLGEQEAERERLQKATSELAEEANDGTERLAAAVRQALDEAKESLASAARPVLHQVGRDEVLQPRMDGPGHARARKGPPQRLRGIGEREGRTPLLGERPVVDDVARERFLPGADGVVEQPVVHIDEHRQVVRAQGHLAAPAADDGGVGRAVGAEAGAFLDHAAPLLASPGTVAVKVIRPPEIVGFIGFTVVEG